MKPNRAMNDREVIRMEKHPPGEATMSIMFEGEEDDVLYYHIDITPQQLEEILRRIDDEL